MQNHEQHSGPVSIDVSLPDPPHGLDPPPREVGGETFADAIPPQGLLVDIYDQRASRDHSSIDCRDMISNSIRP
jgi:hypothetical protein